MTDVSLPSLTAQYNEVTDYIHTRLGGSMVDIELEKTDYDRAIKTALQIYRQRSSNSVEESYCFLDLVKDTQEYILPREIQSVRQVFRRGIGGVTGTTASQFEPFTAGYLNTYMLVAGRVGGLVNYELFAGYQELAMTMFGGHMMFTFNESTKKLTIVRKQANDGETVMLWVYNYKPDQVILNDYKVLPWVQDYALAVAKYTLGEAREKHASNAGPQGGFQLNGTALKAEAKAEMDRLITELLKMVDGSMPLSFIIG